MICFHVARADGRKGEREGGALDGRWDVIQASTYVLHEYTIQEGAFLLEIL